MDYGAGELDYGPLDEEEDVLPSTTGAEKLAQESEFDVFIEPPEESIETTPEPEDPIREVSSAEGRRPLWNSPADSTGDSGIESGTSVGEVARSTSPHVRWCSPRQRYSPEVPGPSISIPLSSRTSLIPRAKRCRLSYHQLPGYPHIQTTYDFLRPNRDKIPALHQLLHICHEGTEKELMDKLEHMIQSFDYQKVVIFARRTERLLDIKVTLKANCGLDSLFIDGNAQPDKVEKVCDWFAQMRRRCLVCISRVLPSTKSLEGVNLVFWWNLPYTFDDFVAVTGRLTTKALIIVVLKQDEDWEFLHMMQERAEVVFPELDFDSSDPELAGFISGNVTTAV